ncbi:MAG: ABC transporter ATP-binding protein YtrB [Firmicutes bacterium ADurb.Bin506]|jgi:ABC-2 type transport system ATP-binding protein|nr:MAG: ABC transporter ATP-binding protein YtrB [Firmicutes bacterium ADurb.Bin506]
MNDNALELRMVNKSYPGFSLRDVSLELPRGYIMGLVGPNGAGKTTTIRLIMNLARPESGTIRVLGAEMTGNAVDLKRRIGYVPENHEFYSGVTTEWTASFVKRLYPTWNDRKFRELLDKYGVDASKKTDVLSKGTRAKLAMAIALAHEPELLILDEPTSGLDPVVRRELLTDLLEFVKDGDRSVLFSTHITSDLERVADYITFLIDGRVAASGERESLLEEARLSNPSASIEDMLWTLTKGGQRRHA